MKFVKTLAILAVLGFGMAVVSGCGCGGCGGCGEKPACGCGK